MLWVKMCDDLSGNPKVKRLRRLTGWDEDQAIGKLYKLWTWTLKYCEDGNLTGITSEDLEDALNWKPTGTMNLSNILIEAGFLDRKPYLRIHDWDQYALRFLQTKYSGTDNDDIPKRVKRAYKSKSSNRHVTVIKHAGNKTEDLDLDFDLKTKDKTSRKTGVKTPDARAQADSQTAFSSEIPPENGKPENKPDPQRDEIIDFVKDNPPRYGAGPLNPDDDYGGQTLDTMLALHAVFGLKAAWLLFIRPGHAGYDFAFGQHFSIREFLRQIPALQDSPLYPPLKKKYVADYWASSARVVA